MTVLPPPRGNHGPSRAPLAGFPRRQPHTEICMLGVMRVAPGTLHTYGEGQGRSGQRWRWTASHGVTTNAQLTPRGVLALGRPFRGVPPPAPHTQTSCWMQAALRRVDLGQSPLFCPGQSPRRGTQLWAGGAHTSRRCEISPERGGLGGMNYICTCPFSLLCSCIFSFFRNFGHI